MSDDAVENEQVWTMKEPAPGSPLSKPGAAHLISCDLAIAAAVARLEHLSYLLRTSPQDMHTADHLLKLAGVYWSEAGSHFEAFRQIGKCDGRA